jgi:hypothetical protein
MSLNAARGLTPPTSEFGKKPALPLIGFEPIIRVISRVSIKVIFRDRPQSPASHAFEHRSSITF